MKEDTLTTLAEELQEVIATAQVLNMEGKATRSRELSVLITDLQSAQNWLARILAPGFIESITE